MYLISFPLLLLPFAFFNIVIFLLNIPLSDPVFTIPLMSTPAVPPVFDRSIAVTTGELLLVPRAASSTLLLLSVISFVDVLTGISIRPAREETIVLEHRDQAPA